MKFFELSVAGKYLIPKKKQLSVSLIALLSVGVISLVVWLLLLFLSITEGMEKNWLHKLTSLNAPLRITPSARYFESYYSLIDSYSANSHYMAKSIGEKRTTDQTDPYSPVVDCELPSSFPLPDKDSQGQVVDPVKQAFAILSAKQQKERGLSFQDYEISGALLRLEMIHSRSRGFTSQGPREVNVLTQASYIASFPDQNPTLASLIEPPTMADLNHLLFLKSLSENNFSSAAKDFFLHVEIEELSPSLSYWALPVALLPEEESFAAESFTTNGKITHITLPSQKDPKKRYTTLRKEKGKLFLSSKEKVREEIASTTPLIVTGAIHLQASLIPASIDQARSAADLRFQIKGRLQEALLQGEIALAGTEISQAKITTHFDQEPKTAPPWIYFVLSKEGKWLARLPVQMQQGYPIVLANGYQENGVKVGDRGHLSFGAATAGSRQEQRLPVIIAGFYNPGIMAVGNRSLLAPAEAVTLINNSNSFSAMDKASSNGIQVWFPSLDSTDQIKQEIEEAFQTAGIAPYWNITSYKEYDFAKDLLQQFQSDKYLFTLVGIIILIVGCSNIISLLVLLVNDKKKEIGILQSMGASSFSIATIFAVCGVTMGAAGTLLGTFAALLTLGHIDSVVNFLSLLQGHDAFNALFYGSSLPNTLSPGATRFILIITPLLSLAAGLIPAVKACRLSPSAILRSES